MHEWILPSLLVSAVAVGLWATAIPAKRHKERSLRFIAENNLQRGFVRCGSEIEEMVFSRIPDGIRYVVLYHGDMPLCWFDGFQKWESGTSDGCCLSPFYSWHKASESRLDCAPKNRTAIGFAVAPIDGDCEAGFFTLNQFQQIWGCSP